MQPAITGPLAPRELLYGMLELFAPRPCVLCGRPVSRLIAAEGRCAGRSSLTEAEGRSHSVPPAEFRGPAAGVAEAAAAAALCARCFSELLSAPESRLRRCTRCSRPLISERELCTTCRATEFGFTRAHALFEYRGAARKLLWFYKFENRRTISRLFAALLAERYAQQFAPAPIVPIPGQKRTRAARGWDQMETLARVLERRHGLTVLPVLRRRASGIEQKRLGRAERLLHATERYQLARRTLRRRLAGHHTVVLLDDVLTTGATASACADLLRDAGVREVTLLALTVR